MGELGISSSAAVSTPRANQALESVDNKLNGSFYEWDKAFGSDLATQGSQMKAADALVDRFAGLGHKEQDEVLTHLVRKGGEDPDYARMLGHVTRIGNSDYENNRRSVHISNSLARIYKPNGPSNSPDTINSKDLSRLVDNQDAASSVGLGEVVKRSGSPSLQSDAARLLADRAESRRKEVKGSAGEREALIYNNSAGTAASGSGKATQDFLGDLKKERKLDGYLKRTGPPAIGSMLKAASTMTPTPATNALFDAGVDKVEWKNGTRLSGTPDNVVLKEGLTKFFNSSIHDRKGRDPITRWAKGSPDDQARMNKFMGNVVLGEGFQGQEGLRQNTTRHVMDSVRRVRSAKNPRDVAYESARLGRLMAAVDIGARDALKQDKTSGRKNFVNFAVSMAHDAAKAKLPVLPLLDGGGNLPKSVEKAANTKLDELLGKSDADVMNSVGKSVQHYVYNNLPGGLGEANSPRETMWSEYRNWGGNPYYNGR